MDILYPIIIVVIGFVAAVSGGFWGLGGGWFILPCLFLTGVSVPVAIGASLIQMIPTTLPTVIKQFSQIGWKKGGYGYSVALPLCVACAIGGLLGDPLGIFLQKVFNSHKPHEAVFVLLLGCILFDIIQLVRKGGTSDSEKAVVKENLNPSKKVHLTVVSGFITGVISGFLGIGGGTMTRPLLSRILKVPEKTTGEIARLAILFTALFGCLPYLIGRSGDMRAEMIKTAVLLTCGGLAGFSIGAKMHSIVLKAGYDEIAYRSFGFVVSAAMVSLICKILDLIVIGRILIALSGLFVLIYLSILTIRAKRKIDRGTMT